jgi:plastocyanin
MHNVRAGAIGIIVIHNADDPDDVMSAPLPGNSAIGSPVTIRCQPAPFEVPVLAHDLLTLGHGILSPHHSHAVPGSPTPAAPAPAPAHDDDDDHDDGPVVARSVRRGDLVLELNDDFTLVNRFCLPVYRDPPDDAQYLLLFHDMPVGGMCINGRRFLGNTPTLVAGANTRMRFGLVAMGNTDGFHTFHLHGHRWIIPGPDGINSNDIQNSAQIRPVSQFEDTRTFGPANSFAFTINPNSFMRSEPPLGEWHMHCHVLTNMMEGMMGSLLKVAPGALALALPSGKPCATGTATTPPGDVIIKVLDNEFDPKSAMVNAGQTVTWDWQGSDVHSTTSDTGVWDSTIKSKPFSFSRPFTAADAGKTFSYHCEVHGVDMSGTITVM